MTATATRKPTILTGAELVTLCNSLSKCRRKDYIKLLMEIISSGERLHTAIQRYPNVDKRLFLAWFHKNAYRALNKKMLLHDVIKQVRYMETVTRNEQP
ncbi:MAG: hypothetical protein WC365_09185 [Candidatus Babeliales bacterium]|jgi:hypothetical protein